jgi:hypothetical protein
VTYLDCEEGEGEEIVELEGIPEPDGEDPGKAWATWVRLLAFDASVQAGGGSGARKERFLHADDAGRGADAR